MAKITIDVKKEGTIIPDGHATPSEPVSPDGSLISDSTEIAVPNTGSEMFVNEYLGTYVFSFAILLFIVIMSLAFYIQRKSNRMKLPHRRKKIFGVSIAVILAVTVFIGFGLKKNQDSEVNAVQTDSKSNLSVTMKDTSFEVTLSDKNVFLKKANTITVNNSTDYGYNLSIYADNSVLRSEKSEIVSVDGNSENQVALSDNTWGIALTDPESNKVKVWQSIPDEEHALIVKSTGYNPTDAGDTTTFYYGAYLTPDIPEGLYENSTIEYMIVANTVEPAESLYSVTNIDSSSYYALSPNYDYDLDLKISIKYDNGDTAIVDKSYCKSFTMTSGNPEIINIENNHIITGSNPSSNLVSIRYSCKGSIGEAFSGETSIQVTSLIHDKNNKTYLSSPSFSDYSKKYVINSSAISDAYPDNEYLKSIGIVNTVSGEGVINPGSSLSARQISILEDILKRKIEAAGSGTRAAIVEAARFLTINFPYRIPYAYGDWQVSTTGSEQWGDENNSHPRSYWFVQYDNNLTFANGSFPNTNNPSSLGVPRYDKKIFGKYFNKGLNLSTSSTVPEYMTTCETDSTEYGNGCRITITNENIANQSWGSLVGKIDQNNCTNNITASGCGYPQYREKNNGTKIMHLNGLDCTGLIYWAFINGGYLPNRSSQRPYNINSILFEKRNGSDWSDSLDAIRINQYATSSKKDRVLPGDLMFDNSGHIGILIGIDDTYFYTAESTGSFLPNYETLDGNTDYPYPVSLLRQLTRGGVIVSRVCKDIANCPASDARDFDTIMLMDGVYPADTGRLTMMWES